MKTALLTTLALCLLTCSFAAPAKYKLRYNANSVTWLLPTSWEPMGLPAAGDTVEIPAGLLLNLSTDLVLNNVYLKLYGVIELTGSNMKLTFNGSSTVVIYPAGEIRGSKNSQQIWLNGLIYQGDRATIVGPQLANATTGGFINFAYVILPVRFTAFTTARRQADVLVQWSAAEETAAAYYEVQRSVNGVQWTAIARVQPARSGNESRYAYTDKNMSLPLVYYRIRQVDQDGRMVYTTVQSLKSEGAGAVVVQAAGGRIAIQFVRPVSGRVELQVVSLGGQVVARQAFRDPSGSVEVTGMPALKGTYVVTLTDGGPLQAVQKIVL